MRQKAWLKLTHSLPALSVVKEGVFELTAKRPGPFGKDRETHRSWLEKFVLRIGQVPKRCMPAKIWARDGNLTNRGDLLLEERERLEQSKLIELLGSTCSNINVRAGELVIESQCYLPPQAVLRSFVIVKRNAEYVMQFELRTSGL